MKKTFILFITALFISCSGEIYEDEIKIGDNDLAYVAGTEKLFSGDVLDKYGEKLGTYKKGIKDGRGLKSTIKMELEGKPTILKVRPKESKLLMFFQDQWTTTSD